MSLRFSTARGSWRLTALGALSLAGYGAAALVLPTDGGKRDLAGFLALFAGLFALYFFALFATRRSAAAGSSLRQALLWALLSRIALLPAGLPRESWWQDLDADLHSREVVYQGFLLYDNDVWRYLWDGHVFGSGFDPYAYAPADLEALADSGDAAAEALFADQLWQDIFDQVSYESYHTVYPPAAQWLFRLHHSATPGSVFTWKLLLVLFDLGTCLLLASILRRRGGRLSGVLIYAWNPLAVKELAGSGHLDAAMIFFLVLTVFLLERRRTAASLAAYGLAILSKVTPVLLLALVLRRVRRRQWWLLGACLFAGYLPFLGSLPIQIEGILAFSREWVFNPGPWLFCLGFSQRILGLSGRALPDLLGLAVTVALVLWTWKRDDGSFEKLLAGAFLVLGGYLVFSAAVMPWYLLWVLPFAALRAATAGARVPEVWAWLTLTALSLLSYLIFIDQIEHRWWLWLEYLGFFAVLAAGEWRRRRPAQANSGSSAP